MNTMKHLLLAPILACGLVLASCGTTTGDRALSGGLLGAGAGAAIGSLSGKRRPRRSDRRLSPVQRLGRSRLRKTSISAHPPGGARTIASIVTTAVVAREPREDNDAK